MAEMQGTAVSTQKPGIHVEGSQDFLLISLQGWFLRSILLLCVCSVLPKEMLFGGRRPVFIIVWDIFRSYIVKLLPNP